jgi:hypothetical protein
MSIAFVGNTATITFPGLTNARLLPGDYRMTINRLGLTDPAGNNGRAGSRPRER